MPDVGGCVKDLTLQIGEIDVVGVEQRERPDTGGGEKLRGRVAEAADADDQRVRGGESRLRVRSELVEQDVPAVAKELGVVHVSREGPPRPTDRPLGGSERSERGGMFHPRYQVSGIRGSA